MAARGEINVKLTLTGLQEFQKGLKQVSSSAKKFGQALKKVGSDARLVARNLTIVGGVAAVAIGKAVTVSKDFESGFAAVLGLLDEGSFKTKTLTEGIKEFEQGVIDLRKSSGDTFESLIQGLFDMQSATGDADNAIRNLAIATELGIAGATDTATAVDALTAVMGSFGEKAGTVQQIAQKFFAAQVEGKTTVGELAREIGKVAALASEAGVSFEELLASVSASTVAAIGTAEAFTGIRAILSSVVIVSAKAKEEAKNLGIEFTSTALRTKGLQKFLSDITESSNFTEQSFERLFGSVLALNSIQAITRDGAQAFNDTLVSLKDETGLLTKFTNALGIQQGTLKIVTDRLFGSFESIQKQVGDALLPVVKEFFLFLIDVLEEIAPNIKTFFDDFGQNILDFVNNARENFPAFIEELLSTAASVGAALKGMGDALKIVGGLVLFLVNAFSGLLDIIPGVEGKSAAFLIVFLQLIGGFRLIGSLITATIAAFGLLDAALIFTGITSTGLKVIFLQSMKSIAFAALATSKRVIASLIVMGTSMTTLSGIMALVRSVAIGFWLALLGPVGIAAAILLAIGGIVTAIFGFENVVIALAKAWEFVVEKVTAAFNAVKKFFGFSGDKEINVNVNQVITRTDEKINGLASGGLIRGPGTGTSDSIPAMLSTNEFVMKAKAVRKFGSNFMHMINRGVLPKFADGGLVPSTGLGFSPIPSAVVAGAGPNKALRPVNLTIPGVGTFPFFDERSTAENMQAALRKSNLNKSAKLPIWYR